jgi:hypothetical protein
LSPDAGGASLGANPTERAAKSQDLNTALIFGPFHQGKGQYSTILWKKNDYFIKKEQKSRHFDAFALKVGEAGPALKRVGKAYFAD